jgi:hypothetical protein
MKGIGYFISIISVFLLAAPSWKKAWEDPTLRACLVLGIAASIAGMLLRWIAARREAKRRSD